MTGNISLGQVDPVNNPAKNGTDVDRKLPYAQMKQIIFNSTNFRDRAVFEIRNKGNRIGAIKNVIKTQFIDWRDWLLLLLCFAPFPKQHLNAPLPTALASSSPARPLEKRFGAR